MNPTDLDIYSPEQMKVSAFFDRHGSQSYEAAATGALQAIRAAQLLMLSVPHAIFKRVCYEECLKAKRAGATEKEILRSTLFADTLEYLEKSNGAAKAFIEAGGLGDDIAESIRKAAEEEQ